MCVNVCHDFPSINICHLQSYGPHQLSHPSRYDSAVTSGASQGWCESQQKQLNGFSTCFQAEKEIDDF